MKLLDAAPMTVISIRGSETPVISPFFRPRPSQSGPAGKSTRSRSLRATKRVPRTFTEGRAEVDIGVTSAHSNDPKEFARELFVRTPAGRILAERAVEKRYNPSGADSPTDLVLRFLKSDGHLE